MCCPEPERGVAQTCERMTWRLLSHPVSTTTSMTYEGARSITGPYLGSLGASALVVVFVAGFREFAGYVWRSFSGRCGDRTGRWQEQLVGHAERSLTAGLASDTVGSGQMPPPRRSAPLASPSINFGVGWRRSGEIAERAVDRGAKRGRATDARRGDQRGNQTVFQYRYGAHVAGESPHHRCSIVSRSPVVAMETTLLPLRFQYGLRCTPCAARRRHRDAPPKAEPTDGGLDARNDPLLHPVWLWRWSPPLTAPRADDSSPVRLDERRSACGHNAVPSR